MGHSYNINFPELTFTSPGVYSYTVKELTPSSGRWITDSRVYRVIITVTKNGDGTLAASLDYPDGFPRFVNEYYDCPPPKPPCNLCKYFDCLPFPMFWFAPPQKPEFMELIKSTPDAFDWWTDLLKRSDESYWRD